MARNRSKGRKYITSCVLFQKFVAAMSKKSPIMVLPRKLVIVLAAAMYLRRRKRQKMRSYVRGINLGRKEEGEFQTLVIPMRTRFMDDYFRIFSYDAGEVRRFVATNWPIVVARTDP